MDTKALLQDLFREFKDKHQKSEKLFNKASEFQIMGGSHNLRLFSPFPFYDIRSQGSKVTDVDGHTYIDFWQGHFANILGHNPKFVLDALMDYCREGQGLATGFPGIFQAELAELLLSRISADKIRFTTSGTLATMYAIMLSIAKTKRELIMKVGGGWHGSHPYALKGISAYDEGFNKVESAGLPEGLDKMIIVTRFNDPQDLEDKFIAYGDRIACFILEPFIGAGGFIFGHSEYLQKAKELCTRYGALLILDEVVSGFRFHAGALQSLYSIQPDLSVFGKAIGGGMPISAIAGKEEVMSLCDREAKTEERVKMEGGTFSAHPTAMLAGLAFIKFLIAHEADIYPKIGRLGEQVRREIERIFLIHGFNVRCTGNGNSIAKNSSVIGVHFLREKCDRITSPEQVWNPKVCDVEWREKIFKLAMLQEGFNIFHGYGAISSAHTEEEIQASLDAVERIAKKWKTYNIK
ncbi:MAG: aminotransferase class III-fold pyridoxal phosphate-dependent enzyme [Candidatus Aminicenantes bacterium]|nr:aminotransferase class III-fold pyridoxal phosphate-dependent enzyme [Candidatus Aminicenantes bacterium]MDH5384335.1 aminotransferase class III-fold pyridoxal phosphate-dependent enzyme [Candidatus Aminicenantes bacterium]MDH5742861.1 aminotransferase class III-fold pyridoxal phosphate-dependent enzyme [Candidatus Aminicenantes bacterium]